MSDPKNRRFQTGFCRLVLFLGMIAPTAAVAADSLLAPENPLQGRMVFESKGCLKCHAVLGEGAFIGPDLGKSPFYGSFLNLGEVMWNHSPNMTRRMKEMLQQRPTFTMPEISQLFNYLYYLRYLGGSGDVKAGRVLFALKGCQKCHGESRQNGAPALNILAAQSTPMNLAQSLWNHGPAMEQQMQSLNIARPQFFGEEISHLAAYLMSLNEKPPDPSSLMKPGNPRAGERVLSQKGCLECHSVLGKGGDRAPELSSLFANRSITEVAGMMWNHGPEMWRKLGSEVKQVVFKEDEMADLIAYLYFVGFNSVGGSADQGQRLFKERGCYLCHDQAAADTYVLSLNQTHQISSPIEMAQLMWNHAPHMERMMSQRNIPWPSFRPGEMADLYQYIRSIQQP